MFLNNRIDPTSFIKRIIYPAIFLILYAGPASSAGLLEKLQDETKSASDTLTKTLNEGANSMSSVLSKSVTGLEELGSVTIAETGTVFNNFMKDFEASRSTFNAAGFYLKTATVYADIPPAVAVTFTNGKLLTLEEYDKLKNKLSEKPVLKALLNTLVSFTKINSGSYAVSETTIKVGLPPTAWAVIPMNKK